MVKFHRPLSSQALRVLEWLASQGAAWRYGLEISAATNVKSGSLYPLLARLAERGQLESQWLPPEREGRPARHAYRITAQGRAAASAAGPAMTTLRIQEAF
jgi:PadR family transcriptional regulator PadR